MRTPSCGGELYVGTGSPDRLDTLVWALTELADPPRIGYIIGGGRRYAGP